MLKRRFEWKDDTELGAGWVPAWNEHLDFPTSGFGAAHDVLEHFPKLGGMQGEMMAFGAMHFVRSEYSWSRGDIYSMQVHDIANELRNCVCDDKQLESPGRSRLQSDYIDADSLREAVREAVIYALGELTDADFSRKQYRRQMPSDICQRIEGWIMKGAVAAGRRYARMGVPQGWQMTDLFNQVAEKFDQVAKQNGEVGEYVDVRIDFNERAVTVVRDYHYT